MQSATRRRFLERAIQGVDEEGDRLRRLISSGEITSPVAEKLTESLRAQRDKLIEELTDLERTAADGE